MSMKLNPARCSGISLVEVLVVVSLISLMSVMGYTSVMEDLAHNELNQAVSRARVIATEIENAKRLGKVTIPFSRASLDQFIIDHGAGDINNYMPVLNISTPYLGRNPRQLFFVEVNTLTTLVSFTVTDGPLMNVKIPSVGRTQIPVNGDPTSVTWTVIPSAGHGLYAAYKLGHIVNEE